MSDSVEFRLSDVEAAALRDLAAQLAALVGDSGARADPAVERLVPDAYPDDREASDEFRGATRADLLERREHDARIVLRDLDSAQPGDGGPVEAAAIRIDPDRLESWLRTLAAIRLVLATRLGLLDGSAADDPDGAGRVLFDWLGYRLDLLLEAAEAHGGR